MKQELRFKVKYGYSLHDQVSITEKELEKAIYAQKFGVVAQLGGKQINGRNIIVIEPHYHYYTGWYDSYQPTTGEDLEQIKRDCPKGIEEMIKSYRDRIDYLVATNQEKLIGKNVPLPQIEKDSNQISDQVKKIANEKRILPM